MKSPFAIEVDCLSIQDNCLIPVCFAWTQTKNTNPLYNLRNKGKQATHTNCIEKCVMRYLKLWLRWNQWASDFITDSFLFSFATLFYVSSSFLKSITKFGYLKNLHTEAVRTCWSKDKNDTLLLWYSLSSERHKSFSLFSSLFSG